MCAVVSYPFWAGWLNKITAHTPAYGPHLKRTKSNKRLHRASPWSAAACRRFGQSGAKAPHSKEGLGFHELHRNPLRDYPSLETVIQ